MDETSGLLEAIRNANERRDFYLTKAKDLAKKSKDLDGLERRMEKVSEDLTNSLRRGQIKWEEYQRSFTENAILSALSAAFLSLREGESEKTLEAMWPEITGTLLPLVLNFSALTKKSIDEGHLRIGDDRIETEDFIEGLPIRSWKALLSRVKRYLVSPAYSNFELGRSILSRIRGNKEMRRLSKLDSEVCPDCRSYHMAGWQPIGELPIPGRGCQCYDRCRCRVEYR